MLVDVGSHFYMEAHVPNPEVVHVNVGCNLILPMLHEEADAFLVKKEQLHRDNAGRKTKEALRLKFRMRLVMEAIAQLHDSQFSANGQR